MPKMTIINCVIKKSNKPVLKGGKPVVLQPDAEALIEKVDVIGNKYLLIGKEQQYFLWIDKINQTNFSYKINNKRN